MKVVAALSLSLLACEPSRAASPDASEGSVDASADGANVPPDAPRPTMPPACPQPPCTLRVSVASDGTQGNDESDGLPTVSGDGLIVVFVAAASNLVAGDTNGEVDTFVRDLALERTTRISIGSGGEPDGAAGPGWITPDGRYVAFTSRASNLISGDTNGVEDAFVVELPTMALDRVSVTTQGGQSMSSITGIGAHSFAVNISNGARHVLFRSNANNLVGDDANTLTDLFLRDRTAGTTVRIAGSSPPNQPTLSGALSADGSVVAFYTRASNLIANDTNDEPDVFVRNTATGVVTLISQSSGGVQGNDSSTEASISANGRLVAFASPATNLIVGDSNGTYDIFLRDIQAGTTTLISRGMGGAPANGMSFRPNMSADGRYVLYLSRASNLVPDDINNHDDAFLFDRMTGTTTRVSVGNSGQEGNGDTNLASLSASGNAVVFTSVATNLVPDDTNGESDTFIRYLSAATSTTIE